MLSIILSILLDSPRLGKPSVVHPCELPKPNDTPSDSGHRLWWGLVDPMCSVMDRSCSRAGQVSLGPVPTTVARRRPAVITPGGYMGRNCARPPALTTRRVGGTTSTG